MFVCVVDLGVIECVLLLLGNFLYVNVLVVIVVDW